MDFLILECNMESALKELNRLQKVAKKMGRILNFETVDAEPLWKEYDTHSAWAMTHTHRYKRVAVPRKRVTVTVDGGDDMLTYGDARFVARIEVTDNAAVIHTAPDYDKTIPDHYYEQVSNRCDHCEHNRYRVRYYLVEKDGELMQVGSTCVKEFIGVNPAHLLRVFESFRALGSYNDPETADFDLGSSSGQFAFGYTVEDVARIAAAVVAIDKQYYKGETWRTVHDIMYPPRFFGTDSGRQEYLDMVDKYASAGMEDIAASFNHDSFTGFVQDMGANNYANNLKAILRSSAVGSKQSFAVLVSGVYIYLKDSGILSGPEKPTKAVRLNEWVDAQVKERVTFENVSVIGATEKSTQFGLMIIYRMLDQDGRTLVWFSTAGNEFLSDAFEQGTKVKSVTATIKKLDEFKGYKNTIVTRCMVEA